MASPTNYNAYDTEMMSVSEEVRSRLFDREDGSSSGDDGAGYDEGLPSEQQQARWFHFLVYVWASPLLSRGAFRYQTATEMPVSDLLRLPTFEQPRHCARVLKREWEREVKVLAPAAGREPSLPRALLWAFWPRLVAGGICRFLSDSFSFISPFLLKALLRWLQSEEEEAVWEGFVLVVAIAVSNLFMSWFLNAGSLHTTCCFAQMSNGLQLMVYDKILAQHPEHGETGHLTTLHASDVQRLQMLAIPIHGVWVTPFLVLGACIALHVFMGWAGVIAMGAMILSSPLQAFLTRKLMRYRTTIVRIADRRVHAINEVLQGIRICKFMNWERNFEERIASIREEEIVQLRLSYFMRAAVTMIANAMPSIVSVILFGVAYAMEGEIEPTRVFPAISMLNVVRIPMLMMPMAIASLMETNVSVTRVRDFLLRPEAEVYVSSHTDDGQPSVDLKNVTVTSRDKATTILSGLSCGFPAAKLSIVHGPTGCGKSTLVKALIGEATVDTASLGHVRVGGSLAYMAQEAWIMNATVRENIVMDAPFDTRRYWRVVRACQLMDDLKQLANGDMTEIGERGVNLSGGQKQRIAFARAAYSDKDIIVMDDPLSAVDAHVCKRLFEDCIMGFMRGKTRILVTHQTQFLGRCDHVVELRDRAVAFCGPVTELEGVEISAEESKSIDDEEEPEQHSAPLMEKEKVVIGEVSWGVYAWFIQLGTLRTTVVMLGLFGVWRAASVIADMWLTWWSSRANVFGRSYDDKDYLMCFGITTAITIALIYFRQVALALFTINVCRQSHAAMVARLIRAPTSFFDTTPMGRILNRFTKDMDGLDVRIPDLLSQILMTSFNLFGMLVLVAITTPFILALLPFLAIAVRLIYVQYARTQRAVKQIESVSRSPVLAVVNETLGGLSTIRAFGMVEHFRHKHDTRADVAARPAYNVRCAQRWLSARTEIIGTVILFFAAYICAISKVTGAGLGVSAKVVGLSLTYVISTTNAVTFLNRSFAEFEADMNSTERIMEYSTQVAQERDVTYDTAAGNPAPSGTWGQNGAIAFNNVSLRYRPGLPLVLKNVSFNVGNGMKVGVVGRTGSGKSTIILTLFRMLELEGGSIEMDGRDIAGIGLSDLRSRITIIPQDPVLFAGTLRSNLDPFGNYSDAELWDALAKSNIKDRIASDAGGLDAPVTEKGANFSVGERQLLCMARAILRRCSILLLDEATASVDYTADQLIQETIRTVFRDCTVLTVAHRLSTIIDADKVVVMGGGEVLEDAAPHELLEKEGGIFAEMVKQLGDEEFDRLRGVAKEHYKGAYAHKTVVVKD